MPFDFSYVLGDGLLGSLQALPMLMSVAAYVLTALGLYSMAQSRGIAHSWLAWVPVADIWILGSLSDQYRYVVKAQKRSRRKLLLTLKIITAVLTTVLLTMGFHSLFRAIFELIQGAEKHTILQLFLHMLLQASGVAVILLPFAITLQVFRFMALYDLYRSCEPETATMFLVLSILFRFTEPFFLFFNREKEKGMPPRKDRFRPAPQEASHQCEDTQQPAEQPEKEQQPEYL